MCIFTAGSPAVEPRWTPEGCVSWGICCLRETPGGQEPQRDLGVLGVLWDRRDWAGQSGMGPCPALSQLPVVPWRLQA